jgi:hypothetical protein
MWFSHALTVASVLLAVIAMTTLVYPPPAPVIVASSSVTRTDLSGVGVGSGLVVYGPKFFGSVGSQRDEYAFFTFDLALDATKTFAHWNTQQIFVSIIGSSEASGDFVLYDAVLHPFKDPSPSANRFLKSQVLNVSSVRNDYPFMGQNLRGTAVDFRVQVEVFPYIGSGYRFKSLQLPGGSDRLTVTLPVEHSTRVPQQDLQP